MREDKVGMALRKVLELEAAGAEVMIVVGEMGRYASVSRMVDEVEARWGAVHGVIHAAGINSPALILESTPDRVDLLLPAKVHGAFHLERRLGTSALDFFVHFSSQACYGPVAGQIGYSAANGVLDALARRRASRLNGLSCAIGWGPWEEIGMAAETANVDRHSTLREADASVPTSVESIDLTLFQTCRRYANGRISYRGGIVEGDGSPGNWVLEHKFQGRSLMAGATLIECMRSTYQHHVAAESIVLSDICFLRPVFVDERGSEIEITFTPDGDRERFEIRVRVLNARKPWVRTSVGVCARGGPQPAPAVRPPIEEIEAHPSEPMKHRYITAGERWTCETGCFRQGKTVWTGIKLGDAYHGDLDHFVLHPALLDMCLGAGLELVVDSVPFTIGTLRIYTPPGPSFYVRSSYRTVAETPIIDVQFVDEAGRLLLDVEDYVRRTVDEDTFAQDEPHSPEPEAGSALPASFRARVVRPGDIESIELRPVPIPEPAPDEVVIETVATSLNFRDVLTALDQMPNAPAEDPVIGGECSGTILAVGSDVTGFEPGDPVVAFAPYAFASHVAARAEHVMPLTRNISMEDAAGIPSVFLTADYALKEIGC